MVERQRQKRQRQLRLEDCQGMVRSRRSFIHSTVDDLSKLQKRLQKTEVATDVKKLLSVLRRLSVCAWAIYQCLNAYAPMALQNAGVLSAWLAAHVHCILYEETTE